MRLRWVKQEDPRGCGHAVLAMIMGRTYAEIVTLIPEPDPAVSGVGIREMDAFLALQGYAVGRRYARKQVDWQPDPFADLHLCHLRVYPDAPCDHWVVMLGDGSVLDPLTPETRRLSDYHQIHNVAAVVPFARMK